MRIETKKALFINFFPVKRKNRRKDCKSQTLAIVNLLHIKEKDIKQFDLINPKRLSPQKGYFLFICTKEDSII